MGQENSRRVANPATAALVTAEEQLVGRGTSGQKASEERFGAVRKEVA